MTETEMAISEPVKLIMTWDIAPTKEREYFEFVVREFIPGLQNLDLEISEAWATSFGNRPQIQVGVKMPDYARLQQMLKSKEWNDLHEQLLEYIVNYNQKVARFLTRFQF